MGKKIRALLRFIFGGCRYEHTKEILPQDNIKNIFIHKLIASAARDFKPMFINLPNMKVQICDDKVAIQIKDSVRVYIRKNHGVWIDLERNNQLKKEISDQDKLLIAITRMTNNPHPNEPELVKQLDHLYNKYLNAAIDS
jgi:hypothetical protein